MATKKLNITSHKAMEIAEKLYNQGYISYPRTETEVFSNEIDLKSLVERQINNQ